MSETIATPENCGLQVTGEDAEKLLAVLNEYLKDFQAPEVPPEGANFLMGGQHCTNWLPRYLPLGHGARRGGLQRLRLAVPWLPLHQGSIP